MFLSGCGLWEGRLGKRRLEPVLSDVAAHPVKDVGRPSRRPPTTNSVVSVLVVK